MSEGQNVIATSRVKAPGRGLPAWWLIFTREMADLWIGGKALNLILIYCVLLGIMVYVYSFNSELSLIPPKEMVYEMLKNGGYGDEELAAVFKLLRREEVSRIQPW